MKVHSASAVKLLFFSSLTIYWPTPHCSQVARYEILHDAPLDKKKFPFIRVIAPFSHYWQNIKFQPVLTLAFFWSQNKNSSYGILFDHSRWYDNECQLFINFPFYLMLFYPSLLPIWAGTNIDYRCDDRRVWLSAHNCQISIPTSQNQDLEQQIWIFEAD